MAPRWASAWDLSSGASGYEGPSEADGAPIPAGSHRDGAVPETGPVEVAAGITDRYRGRIGEVHRNAVASRHAHSSERAWDAAWSRCPALRRTGGTHLAPRQ